MMLYLLGTCTVSENSKVNVGKADQTFADWIRRVDASSFYGSSIILMKLKIGILRTWFDNHVLR